jgi:hypothetical protein
LNYYDIPERNLEPPEDTRKRAFSCAICEEGIMEGDDYFEIPGLGPCCEGCIDDAKRHDAEREYPEYEREED